MAVRWRIQLLGGLRAQRTERVVNRFRSHRTGLLLAYLALHSRHPQPREALIEMLWPEIDIEIGRTNLRSVLHALRRELEPGDPPAGSVLITDRQSVQLDPAAFSTDVAELREAVRTAAGVADPARRAGALTAAVSLYRGELLPGFFETWVLAERRQVAELYLSALQQLAAALEHAGDLEGALTAARRAVAADPLREEAHYDLMRLYAAAGQPSATVKQYHELERLLREELGETPSAASRALAEELRQSARTVVVARSLVAREPALGNVAPPALPPPVSHPGRAAAMPRLPLQLTRFFGREEEIARLMPMLRSIGTRLVTLTGPGGSGKTRLAIAVAGRLQEEFGEGAPPRSGGPWFVPLAEVKEADRLGDAVRQAMGLSPAAGLEPLEQVLEALQSQRSLLVLDNFEQLVEEGAALIHRLLVRSPGLTCLVTSRRRLELAGEQELIVLPLPAPADRGERGPETLLQYPAVALFVDRAQAARPGFRLTAENADAVAILCDRLEGLPLAIELAAARACVLTPRQILARLTQRFELLVSDQRDRSPRHRSLHAAIEWSYQQLDPVLQRFFTGLSVFCGGWSLESAEAVCEQSQALECLEELRKRSLVLTDEAPLGGEMRYRLLEMLRAFGARLLTDEQQTELSRRHAEYFTGQAEQAEAEWAVGEQQAASERLAHELANLRAALAWGLDEASEGDLGVRLAGAMVWFWPTHGYLGEGRQWLDQTLRYAASGQNSQIRARLLLGTGWLLHLQGEFASARTCCEESLSLFRAANDPLRTAHALYRLGWIAYHQSEFARARAFWEETLALRRPHGRTGAAIELLRHLRHLLEYLGDAPTAISLREEEMARMRRSGGSAAAAARLVSGADLAREQGDPVALHAIGAECLALAQESPHDLEIVLALHHLGLAARDLGEYGLAQALLEQSLTTHRALQRQIDVHLHLWSLAQTARLAGDLETARARGEESLQVARELGSKETIAHALDELRLVAIKQGEWQTARSLPRESLTLWHELGNLWGLAEALEGVAHLSIARGEALREPGSTNSSGLREAASRTAHLLGATERLRETIGRSLQPHERADYTRSVQSARAALGEVGFAAIWAEGRTLTPEHAVALALAL